MKMNIYKLLLFTVFYVYCNVNLLFSQETANISNLNQYIEEVYLNCPQYQNDELNLRYSQNLNQVIFHSIPLGEHPNCPLLSSVGIKNKCNPGLTFSLDNFSPQTFNPLKYQFNYYSNESLYYRVDGLDYIIEIKQAN